MRGNVEESSSGRRFSPARPVKRTPISRDVDASTRRRSDAKSFVEDEDDSLAREAPTAAAAKPLLPDDAPLSPGSPDAEQTIVDLSRPDDDDDNRSIRSTRSIIEKLPSHKKESDHSDSALYTPGPSDVDTEDEELDAAAMNGKAALKTALNLEIPEMKPRAASTYPTTRPSREIIEGLEPPHLVNSPIRMKPTFLSPMSATRHDHETGFPRRQSARPADENVPTLNKRQGGAYSQTFEQPSGKRMEPNSGRPKEPPTLKPHVRANFPLPYDAEPSVIMPSHADYVFDPRPEMKRGTSEYAPDIQIRRPSAALPTMTRPEPKRTSTDYHSGSHQDERRKTERTASRSRGGSNASEAKHILSPKPERASTLPLNGERPIESLDPTRARHVQTFPMDPKRHGLAPTSPPVSSPSPGTHGPNRFGADTTLRNASRLSSGASSKASTRANSPAVAQANSAPLKKMTPIREISWDEWYAQSERPIQLCSKKRMIQGAEWYSLRDSDSVDICTDCYEKIFASTPYSQFFNRRPRDLRKIRCEMSHQWVVRSLKDAKRMKNPLRFIEFIQVASVNFCDYLVQGDGQYKDPDRTKVPFYTVRDPLTKHRAKCFDVCEQCKTKLLTLIPELGDVFVRSARLQPGEFLECDLRDDGPRWDAYISMFSRASKIKRIEGETKMLDVLAPWLDSVPDEICPGQQPAPAGLAWHYVSVLPHFTICPDCYWREVLPRMHRDKVLTRVSAVPEVLPVSTPCYMASKQLRNLFLDAAEARDWELLRADFEKRLWLEGDYRRAIRKFNEAMRDLKTHQTKCNTLRNQLASAVEIQHTEELRLRSDEDVRHYERKMKKVQEEWVKRWDDPLPVDQYVAPDSDEGP